MSANVPSRAPAVPDAQLLGAYAGSGDPEAFKALVDRHINMVFSAARRQMTSQHDAEDVTQAVFIILARQAGKFDQHVILPAWLYRATLFACHSARKAQTRRKRHEMAAATHKTEAVGDTAPGVAEQWTQWLPLLDAAMASLGEKDRTLLLLRFFQGLNTNELAVAMGPLRCSNPETAATGDRKTASILRPAGHCHKRDGARLGIGRARRQRGSGGSIGCRR